MSKIKIFSLGGLDENGKNNYIIEIDKSIFVFDCGLKYASGNMLGIDYIIPDFEYLVKNRKRIKPCFKSRQNWTWWKTAKYNKSSTWKTGNFS